MAAVALELLFEAAPEAPAVVEHALHLGPAEAFDGGIAHVGGHELHPYIWYSVRTDSRPCPFCGMGFDEGNAQHCVAIMADGEWRWAHPLCAVNAKGGFSDMAIGAPWKRKEWPACARCGGRFREDHHHDSEGAWCADGDELVNHYQEAA